MHKRDERTERIMNKIYKAHINEDTGEIQTVQEHSENTARLCQEYAIPELKACMYAIGLLHDIGKFQENFQRRINGEPVKVEHSVCGALVAKEHYSYPIGLMMEYCIAGHHSGIPDGGYKNDTADMSTLHGRMHRTFEDYSVYKKLMKIPTVDQKAFLDFLLKDCERNSEVLTDKFTFLTRYAFSCLVDADSTDTATFYGEVSERSLTADFEECLEKVNENLRAFICTTPLQRTRALLQQQVFQKTGTDSEIYLMNMPTGSGKTLCSVKFALERAIRTGKKRIIYVIPYNSIIDQIMIVFENMFGNSAEILRHQSTFSYDDKEDADEDYRKAAKHATENWDVSTIIVTTAVQFFESVYANKRRRLRKMHNMADSILIFDEAHLMPQKYLQPCLRAIVYITKYLNSEAVFLTATMPDFPQLLQQYTLKNSKIEDLISDRSHFSKFRKCEYQFLGEIGADTLLAQAGRAPSSLIVVNKRKTARKLFQLCGGRKYHLSTYMTAHDREQTLQKIRQELQQLETDYSDYRNVSENRKITIISTSLIEAGVDLDIHTVFRELTGLDSILQAGGRCNREGKRSNASVYVFELEDDCKTKQNLISNITMGLLEKYEDISCPESIQEYYGRLFAMNQEEIKRNTVTQKCSGITDIPFATYAMDFEVIDSRTVSLVVPQDSQSRALVETLKYTGGTMGLARKLQKYTCSVYKNEAEDLVKQHAADDFGTGIICLTNMDYYDPETGITFDAHDYFL